MDVLSLFDVEPSGPTRVPSPAPATVSVSATAPAAPVLLAVDGNSLAHRAFHAYGRVDESLGVARGGLYGFVALLCAISDKVGADGVVVGFDCRSGSERKRRHPEYKANRAEKDPALYDLLDEAPTVLVELGVPVIVPPGWEADDVVGSAAASAEAAGWRCVVATSDRDAFSLISGMTSVLRLRSGLDNAIEMDAAALRRAVGVAPQQYVQFAALRGDSSDNLPGIPGIGPSRAKAVLGAYATIEDAVADPMGCRSVLGRSLGQALIDDLASPESVFRRNVGLMSIRRDLPVHVDSCRRRAGSGTIERCLRAWELPMLTARAVMALGARPDLVPPPLRAPGE
ncbi:MAG: flap endonuclease [Nitriliruptorales bacterium]|nr:flap endonuclease [Nitriliruptorales bacterium]